MIATRVFVDANVLYSRTLRDWLGLLYFHSSGGVYAVYWTEDVLAEAMYRLRRNNPTWDGGKITQIHDLVAKTFQDGRVEDYVIDDSFPGADANDRHVHAAALSCRADIVLTSDNGFTTADPDAQPYEVYHPDDFFVLVDDSAPQFVHEVTREQTLYWAARQNGRADLPDKLIAAGCPEFAERVRRHQGQLTLPGDPTHPPSP